ALTFLGYPVGSLLSLPLVERLERKHLLVASGLAMAVFGLLFGLSDAPVAIVIFGFLYTVISNVFSNSFHIYQAEIFPTRLRATASGSTYGLSRLSNALLPFILLPVLAAFGPVAMFAVVSLAMVIVALDIGLLGPRSTGRDLESVNTVEASSHFNV
ncbi:MAG: transporter, putative metabolite:H+ symporter, partial [Pseudonocardiales bacterium]|nr:transporter, putative metabolite:H+ symporter [Pseudonocardiales bacterium]